jgi:hypothetical protein
MNQKTKLFYQGRRINGRFDSFKAKCRRAGIYTVRAAVIVTVLYGTFTLGALVYSTDNITVANAQEVNQLPAKIADLKADVIDQIQSCETPNLTEDDAPIILDPNNRMSIGSMMFQIATVQEYEKSLYGKTVTRKETVEIALDEKEAKALANDIVFKEDGLGNWLNCANKVRCAPHARSIC